MKKYDLNQIRCSLEGPVFPIITPFDSAYNLDLKATGKYVDFLVNSGAQTIMTTVGTSRFNLLSNEEIIDLNTVVSDRTKDSALSIVSGPLNADLSKNIEHAVKAQEIGANAFIAYYPERWYDDDSVFSFYQEICKSVSIGIFIHEMPLRSGYGGTVQYSLHLLDKLLNIPNLVGLKEECMDASYSYKIHRHFGDNGAIIGAGAMRNFLRDKQAGARCNLVGLGSFFPNIEIDFHLAIKDGKNTLANEIVQKYEDDYFDLAVELGWHTQLKFCLNYFGLLPHIERPPLKELSKQKQNRIIDFFEQKGWLNFSATNQPQIHFE